MKDLIERLEKATGPDRELDADIYNELSNDEWVSVGLAPDYTASLDAAMTLIPQSWTGCLDGIGSHSVIARFGPPTDEACEYSGEHANPAIALCMAALRARMGDALIVIRSLMGGE